jgi:hypothetical protein
MTIASPFEGFQIPAELVCEFFAVFSRFEFTLKENGFIQTRNGHAEPSWRCFSAAVSKSLRVETDSALEQALAYLVNEPPQIQISKEQWHPISLHGATAIEQAIDAVTRARNNLFHGGKHTPHSPPGRDEKLVRSSLTVLYACLEQDATLRSTYEQNVV